MAKSALFRYKYAEVRLVLFSSEAYFSRYNCGKSLKQLMKPFLSRRIASAALCFGCGGKWYHSPDHMGLLLR